VDTIWSATFPFRLSADLRDVLPSPETPVMLAKEPTKHGVASSVAKMSPG
jgi:hypothetical protein